MRPGIEVSVIVPVRDDEERLRRLLALLERQTLARDRFEIVIGDDGSRDAASLCALATRDEWCRVVSGPPRNSYEARNGAVAASHAAVLAFTDADCEPEPDWLEHGLSALDGHDVVAGEICFRLPRPPSVWALVDSEAYLDQEQSVRRQRGATANLFLRRSLFDQLGGFDSILASGGDYDLVARATAAGAAVAFAPDARVWHPARGTARSLLRKAWRTTHDGSARAALRRDPFSFSGLLLAVPLVSTAVRRLTNGRPVLRLDRRSLARSGIRPRGRDDLACMIAVHGVVGQIELAARLSGWLRGRFLRLRRGRREGRHLAGE